jgi:hypothetical protein
MSHWISVYCQKRIPRFSASMLEKAIRRGCTDYRGYDYFDELFAYVKVTEYADRIRGSLLSLYHLTYKLRNAEKPSAGHVPIVVERITEPETVEGMVQEQLEEYLKRRKGPKAALVRSHLEDVAEIFSFCLKAEHGEEAGSIVVSVARLFLAQKGQGIVREDGVGWLKWTPHGLFEALRE